MGCTFKTVFYVNGSKERNGIVPIMGRVTINGTIAQFSCKQSVSKAIWDAKGNRAIGKSKETKMCGIKKRVSFHVSRHSWAVLALEHGMPIESVSKILGHTNITCCV